MAMTRFAGWQVALGLAVCSFWMGMRPDRALALPSQSVAVFQAPAERQAQVQKVMQLMARPEGRLQMMLAGIQPEQLQGRLERMEDSHLQWAAERADQVKAAGELGLVIGLLVLILVIILVLWLLVEMKEEVED